MSQTKQELMDIAKGDVVKTNSGSSENALSNRWVQESQAQVISAKRFPRDVEKSKDRVLKSCERISLAETATYEYPRGNETVTGPSIRLAEVIAQNYGNLEFGIVELSQTAGVESEVMAYCTDHETNTRAVKIFHVPHIRATRKGKYTLEDPRDIYELVANMGARRLRACILSIIPGDVTEEALTVCDQTIKDAVGKEPIEKRIEKIQKAFAEYSVTREEIEQYLGYKLNSITPTGIVKLQKVYNSLKDGMANKADYFKPPAKENTELQDIATKNTSVDKSEGKKEEPKDEGENKNDVTAGNRDKLMNDINNAKDIPALVKCAKKIQDALQAGDLTVKDGEELIELYKAREKGINEKK